MVLLSCVMILFAEIADIRINIMQRFSGSNHFSFRFKTPLAGLVTEVLVHTNCLNVLP